MPLVSVKSPNTQTSTHDVSHSEDATSSSHFENGDGKQELCPGSGVYIPSIKLRQCHHKAGAEMKVLFHVLLDHFFSEEVLAKSVAFGNRVIPSGKEILNPKIVSAIKGYYQDIQFLFHFITHYTKGELNTVFLYFSGYLLSAAKVLNVSPLDGAKLNKMFTNKCTAAQTKMKKKLTAMK